MNEYYHHIVKVKSASLGGNPKSTKGFAAIQFFVNVSPTEFDNMVKRLRIPKKRIHTTQTNVRYFKIGAKVFIGEDR